MDIYETLRRQARANRDKTVLDDMEQMRRDVEAKLRGE